MTILWAEIVFLTKAASDESADDTKQRDAAIIKTKAIEIFTAIEALNLNIFFGFVSQYCRDCSVMLAI